MTPTNILLDQLATLLATDPTQLAPVADACHIHLIKAPFTPGPLSDFTTMTAADFTGSTAKSAGVGAQQHFWDPVTSRRVVQLVEPAGGWHWQASAAPTPAQTIYGIAVTDHADLVTYGSALLTSPVTIANIGDAVDIANVRLSFVPPVLI